MTADDEEQDDLLFRLRAADSELCREAAEEIQGLSRAMARLMGERDRLVNDCHKWSLRMEEANLKIRALSGLGP